MNCVKGDLAVVIRSKCNNEGKIVHCVKYLGERQLVSIKRSNSNVVEPPLKGVFGNYGHNFPDRDLKPLRDSDEEDETLSWKALEHHE